VHHETELARAPSLRDVTVSGPLAIVLLPPSGV